MLKKILKGVGSKDNLFQSTLHFLIKRTKNVNLNGSSIKSVVYLNEHNVLKKYVS
jgi:hypothetical protein